MLANPTIQKRMVGSPNQRRPEFAAMGPYNKGWSLSPLRGRAARPHLGMELPAAVGPVKRRTADWANWSASLYSIQLIWILGNGGRVPDQDGESLLES